MRKRVFNPRLTHIVIVKEIGALSSTIVPQGLAFAMTLLFAYGAAHLFGRNVLLQEVNATEKLGRIKNLCMDKTGTLTENMLVVERMETAPGVTEAYAGLLTAAYVKGSGDTSQTITAIQSFHKESFAGETFGALTFSSWRSYGATIIQEEGVRTVVIAGAPEYLLPHITNQQSREWLLRLIQTETTQGKRVFCVAHYRSDTLPEKLLGQNIIPVAVYIFSANLRPGIKEAIAFFQQRNVRIRIISGDHPQTVRAIAASAGVEKSELVTTGEKMSKWSDVEFSDQAKAYTIFARTLPEQKQKIIEALKIDGFTAMVGDGANDALAIKHADLGIAMWEGAPATRQVASVILMNNSFTSLPGGVELADSIIKNAEIFANIFFGSAITGFFLFILTSMFGYPYPLSPLNITLINYFIVGFPGILISYWTIRPANKLAAPNTENFLKNVLSFAAPSSLLQAIAIMSIFLLSPEVSRGTGTNLYAVLASIAVGIIFFLFVPKVYRGALAHSQLREMVMLIFIELLAFILIFQVPFLLTFFDIHESFPTMNSFLYPMVIVSIYTIGQFVIAKRFTSTSAQMAQKIPQ
jgi:cation-transporting ATPase E